MPQSALFRNALSVCMLVFFLIGAAPAMAQKPEWAGDDKRGKPKTSGKFEKDRRDDQNRGKKGNDQSKSSGQRSRRHFNDHHTVVINNYYVQHFHSSPCPPGLKKKGNGCVPRGQVKKWHYGQPLPPKVIYYDLPPAVLVELGPAPNGYKFVRVAQDILMIAVGTGMVMDAIEDIGSVID